MKTSLIISLTIMMTTASVAAQASGLSEAIECRLLNGDARWELALLMKTDEMGGDGNKATVFDVPRSTAFGFEVVSLSLHERVDDFVKLDEIVASVRGDYETVRAKVLSSVGVPCQFESARAGRGFCEVTKLAGFPGRLSVREKPSDKNMTEISCMYEG